MKLIRNWILVVLLGPVALAGAAQTLSPINKLNLVDAGAQINPGVGTFSNGNFVVVYEDRAAADGSDSGIFGSIYDSNMELVQDCGVVNTKTASFQTFPHVAVAPNDNFMVVWSNFTNTFGQLFSSTCERLGEEKFLGATFNGLDVGSDSQGNFWVVRSINGKAYLNKYSNEGTVLLQDIIVQDYASPVRPERTVLAVLSDDSVLVTWYNVNEVGSSDIFGAIVNADGTIASEAFLINSTTMNNQISPFVADLSAGGFIAVWMSDTGSGSSEIRGRLFSSDGTAGDEFVISPSDLNSQLTPYVIGRSSGGFSVGWTDQADPQHVYLASYDATGTEIGGRVALSSDEALMLTVNDEVELAELADGSVIGVWAGNGIGNWDIYGRVVRASADPFWELSPLTKVNTVVAGEQVRPSVDALPDGNFFVAYEDRAGADGGVSGIFGAVYNSDMQLVHDCGVLNATTNSYQEFPHVAVAPNGVSMVIWRNFTNTFGQRFSPSCERLGEETFLGATFNGHDVVSDSEGNFWVARSINGKGYLNKYSNDGVLLLQNIIYQSYTLPELPGRVRLAAMADGRVMITWYNVGGAEASKVYGVFVDADGTVSGDSFPLSTDTTTVQSGVVVEAFSDGGFVAIWSSEVSPGVSQIMGRVFSADGSGGDEFVVSAIEGVTQSTPFVEARHDGGFTVAWTNNSTPSQVDLATFSAEGVQMGRRIAFSADESVTMTGDGDVELAELSDGSLVGVWMASNDIYGRRIVGVAPVLPPDFDEDGIPDSLDPDDDNDGVEDEQDAFPFDASESLDTDSDGIGNNADTDDDNDGVVDSEDDFPLDPSEIVDTDGDRIGNNIDTDDDNDGVSDEQEVLDGTDPLDPTDFVPDVPPLQGHIYSWFSHVLMGDVNVRVNGSDGMDSTVISDLEGAFKFSTLNPGFVEMNLSKPIVPGDLNRTITSSDALAALKIAVGLNPNPDPDGAGPLLPLPVSPYQLIAADANQDGRVSSGDALAILKAAVGLNAGFEPSWRFIEEATSVWDTHADRNLVWTGEDGYSFNYPDLRNLNFVSVLVGDVNGSWEAGPDAVYLEDRSFAEKARVLNVPVSIWMLRDSDLDGLSDEFERATGTDPNLYDSDGDGVSDDLDQCNQTLEGVQVDVDGCAVESNLEAIDQVSRSQIPAAELAKKLDFQSLTVRFDTLQSALLRGDMNDWGVDLPFIEDQGGRFRVAVKLDVGAYAFKVASPNWTELDLGAAPGADRVVRSDSPVQLYRDSNAPVIFEVLTAGEFQFEITSNLRLTVARADVAGDSESPATKQGN
jgi:hypothetical protein